jgi:predicted AAA+ superfamily ATPase
MAEELKEKIFEFLKSNQGKEFSLSQIKKEIGLSYNTISKWITVLNVEDRIIVKDFGNIKLISIK